MKSIRFSFAGRPLSVPTLALSLLLSTAFYAARSASATAPVSAAPAAPYRVLKTAKVGGDGGFDYVAADADGRRLYIARSGPSARITIFDLDTLAPAGELPLTSARGVAVDTASHHAFASSSPVAMWDTKTNALIKTIPVEGRPDGILADPLTHRIFVFSHSAPNATVINAADGAVLGTIDLGGAPEQAVTDGAGHLYVDLEDKDSVAVVDSRAMKVTATYDLKGKGGGNAGLALDVRNHVLFVACRTPQVMVMLDANDGKYLADLPIGRGCDGAVFSPATGECFSSQGDGTLTVIKETSPTSFTVAQTVATLTGAKTLTLDSKTGTILLIAAQYGPAPSLPAGTLPTVATVTPVTPVTPVAPVTPPVGAQPGPGRGRRPPMIPGSFSILVVGK